MQQEKIKIVHTQEKEQHWLKPLTTGTKRSQQAVRMRRCQGEGQGGLSAPWAADGLVPRLLSSSTPDLPSPVT